jgi:hypothetical protein
MEKLENFFLSDDILRAFDPDEVCATIEAMSELGIDHTPFSSFCITFKEKSALYCQFVRSTKNKEMWTIDLSSISSTATWELCIRNSDGSTKFGSAFLETIRRDGAHAENLTDHLKSYGPEVLIGEHVLSTNELVSNLSAFAANMIRALIVGLATKVVRKNRVEEKPSKLEKLGIGKPRAKKNYAYTTTLSLPVLTTTDESGASTGVVIVRPHLRRGHVRLQHFGPKNQFSKKIFVEPVFVNGDENSVSLRDRYNVNKRQELSA